MGNGGVGEEVMSRGGAGFWEVPTCVDDDVLGQVTHVDESFVADSAFVGPDVVVVTDVVGQLARLDEPLGMTPQSPQSMVSPQVEVPHDVPIPLKRPSWYSQGESSPLPTPLAHIGLLPGVLAHMGNEGACLGEGFPTDQALARLLSWGNRGEGGWGERGEGEPFGEAGADLYTSVDADVALECTGVGELALAVHAHVRLLPAVDPQVPLQVTWEQGRLKDTRSSSPFSSFPKPQKLPWESLVLFREHGLQGLCRDQGKLAAPCLGSGNNVKVETARTSTHCFRGSKDSTGIIPTFWLCSRLGENGRRHPHLQHLDEELLSRVWLHGENQEFLQHNHGTVNSG